jgi:SdrD B-like domain
MSRTDRSPAITSATAQLLQGPLKHAKAAALAAALVPLASVAATPARAQSCLSGGSLGNYVWQDTNANGVQDFGEAPIAGAVVTLAYGTAPDVVTQTTATDEFGQYQFYLTVFCEGTYTVSVQIPPGLQPSPANAADDALDSDGAADGLGNSVAVVSFGAFEPGSEHIDFGFHSSGGTPVGTGTPGYWKTHPEAWPASVVVGGVSYTRDQAIAWLGDSGSDKTVTMFASLVSAKLNVAAGTDASCVQSTIDLADAWMEMFGPVGRKVKASSYAWKVGEPLHRLMDNYNNGMLCAPHRN